MDREPVFPDLLHSHQGEHTADLEPNCRPAGSRMALGQPDDWRTMAGNSVDLVTKG